MTILDSKSFYHVDICFICAADKFWLVFNDKCSFVYIYNFINE